VTAPSPPRCARCGHVHGSGPSGLHDVEPFEYANVDNYQGPCDCRDDVPSDNAAPHTPTPQRSPDDRIYPRPAYVAPKGESK